MTTQEVFNKAVLAMYALVHDDGQATGAWVAAWVWVYRPEET